MSAPAVSTNDLHRGKVASFSKTYGFITPQGGGTDIFVHFTAITDSAKYKKLDAGQEVEFKIVDGPKGVQAADVRVVE